MVNILAVVLCGGDGERLWPLSRKNYPKQFIQHLFDELSLFQMTILRLKKIEHSIRITCIGNEKHIFIIKQQLQQINAQATIILETKACNTFVSAMASGYFAQQIEIEKMLIVPADQICHDEQFVVEIKTVITKPLSTNIMIFGSKVINANCDFGYIKATDQLDNHLYKVEQFIEKPNASLLTTLITKYQLYCNNGMILCHPKNLLSTGEKLQSKLCLTIKKSINIKNLADNVLTIQTDNLSKQCNQSIDKAFLMHIDNLIMWETNYSWRDMGSWEQIMEHCPPTNNRTTLLESKNCYVKNDNPNLSVILNDVNDIGIYISSDILCVSSKRNIGKINNHLAATLSNQLSVMQNIEYRRWGFYKILFNCNQLIIKELHIKVGLQTSLQTHKYRAEYWMVSKGEAEITVNKNKYRLQTSQAAYIAPNDVHNIKNIHKEKDLVIIEVQYGEILSETDITRLSK